MVLNAYNLRVLVEKGGSSERWSSKNAISLNDRIRYARKTSLIIRFRLLIRNKKHAKAISSKSFDHNHVH